MENKEKLLELTKEIGRLIQSNEDYISYMNAKKQNDNDGALQKCIGEFNLLKFAIDEELVKSDEEKDEEKIKRLNDDLRRVYADIMVNNNMQEFQESKRKVDELVNKIYSVILQCASGMDPEEATFDDACTGDCSSCGGCH